MKITKEAIKHLCLSKGVDLVGIGDTDFPLYPTSLIVGIVIPAGMREKGFFPIIPKYLKFFSTTNKALNAAAKALKKEGYRTNKQTAFSFSGDLRPYVERAGLGSKGENEMVLNPKFGANVLYAALYTDCKLSADEKVYSVCIRCYRCRRACPAQALTEKGLNVRRCLPYALTGCQKCLDVCPIGRIEYKNRKDYH